MFQARVSFMTAPHARGGRVLLLVFFLLVGAMAEAVSEDGARPNAAARLLEQQVELLKAQLAGTRSELLAAEARAVQLEARVLELQDALRLAGSLHRRLGEDRNGTAVIEDLDDIPDSPEMAHNSELRESVDKLIRREQERQRVFALEDSVSSSGGPKEITILCPHPPGISIVDLYDDEQEQDECLVLNFQAPDVNSRLVIYCDGTVQAPPSPGAGTGQAGDSG